MTPLPSHLLRFEGNRVVLSGGRPAGVRGAYPMRVTEKPVAAAQLVHLPSTVAELVYHVDAGKEAIP